MKIDYKKVSNADEAFAIVKENITPETIEKYKVKADVNYDESAKKIIAKGKGFELVMGFSDTNMNVDLDLSFLLKPLRSKILESLEKQLTRLV